MEWKDRKTTAHKTDNATGRNKSKDILEEGRLKRYQNRIKQYKQIRTFQKNIENSFNTSVEKAHEQINNRVLRKQNIL